VLSKTRNTASIAWFSAVLWGAEMNSSPIITGISVEQEATLSRDARIPQGSPVEAATQSRYQEDLCRVG
jgi:hypothetical protein